MIYFVPYLRTAVSTTIFIPVAIRKDQEQKPVYRHCTPAVGAVEFGGIQFLKMLLSLSDPSGRGTCNAEWTVVH